MYKINIKKTILLVSLGAFSGLIANIFTPRPLFNFGFESSIAALVGIPGIVFGVFTASLAYYMFHSFKLAFVWLIASYASFLAALWSALFVSAQWFDSGLFSGPDFSELLISIGVGSVVGVMILILVAKIFLPSITLNTVLCAIFSTFVISTGLLLFCREGFSYYNKFYQPALMVIWQAFMYAWLGYVMQNAGDAKLVEKNSQNS